MTLPMRFPGGSRKRFPKGSPGELPAAVTHGGRAVIVFSDATDLKKLKLLKRKFRHCCAVVEAGPYWVFFNPTSRAVEIHIFEGLNLADITGWFLGHGHTVVCSRVRPAGAVPAPVRAFTCVEAVKRLLGIRAPWVLTPWQLFSHLTGAPDGM